MNRYPLWKYIIIAVALVVGFLYTLPNFFGEVPAVQISSAKSTAKVDEALRARVEQALAQANIVPDGVFLEATSIRCDWATPTQLKAGRVQNAWRRLHRSAQPAVEFTTLAHPDKRAAVYMTCARRIPAQVTRLAR
jgi:hypothetical protein